MRLPILTYHGIDRTRSPVSVSPDALSRHVARLDAAGYTVCPLSEALSHFGQPQAGTRPIMAMVFDDGYATTHTFAAPLLASHGWRATIFPVSDYIDRDNRWPGQPGFVPSVRLVSWTQLVELASLGWEIGAHTRTHPDLTRLADAALADELQGAKTLLEDRLGQPVRVLAYPYGRHNRRIRALARALYAGACTTEMGIATERSDRHALERVDMWYFSGPLQQQLLASPWMAPYVMLRQAGRHAGRLASVTRRNPER
jgi:peptidoglycan/xylan/chitin deacetylase (PgdA/CDA1 family)